MELWLQRHKMSWQFLRISLVYQSRRHIDLVECFQRGKLQFEFLKSEVIVFRPLIGDKIIRISRIPFNFTRRTTKHPFCFINYIIEFLSHFLVSLISVSHQLSKSGYFNLVDIYVICIYFGFKL